jgi:hypothetical protein
VSPYPKILVSRRRVAKDCGLTLGQVDDSLNRQVEKLIDLGGKDNTRNETFTLPFGRWSKDML